MNRLYEMQVVQITDKRMLDEENILDFLGTTGYLRRGDIILAHKGSLDAPSNKNPKKDIKTWWRMMMEHPRNQEKLSQPKYKKYKDYQSVKDDVFIAFKVEGSLKDSIVLEIDKNLSRIFKAIKAEDSTFFTALPKRGDYEDIRIRTRKLNLHNTIKNQWRIEPGTPIYNVEMKSLEITDRMSLKGIKVNTESLNKSIETIDKTLEDLKVEVLTVGIQNPNNNTEVGEYIYDKKRYLTKNTTRTGATKVTVEILEEIKDKDPIIEKIIAYRKLLKTSGMMKRLLEDSENGRVHCKYDLTTCPTGRIYTKEPNLQQLPPSIQSYLEADEGYYLINADYKS